MLDTVTAVIPLLNGRVVDSAMARDAGYRHLSSWLNDIEAKWAANSNQGQNGEPRATLKERIDHMRKLSCQLFAAGKKRVAYTASGALISAAEVTVTDSVIEHAAYWSYAHSENEAAYLIAILNSTNVVGKIRDLQVTGEAGTRRHLDNLVWTLPIPEYTDTEPLHRDLAAAARRAEAVASSVPLTDAQHFTAKRRAIRAALVEDGIAGEIESLVDALLPP